MEGDVSESEGDVTIAVGGTVIDWIDYPILIVGFIGCFIGGGRVVMYLRFNILIFFNILVLAFPL